MEDQRDNPNIIGSEIIIYQTEVDIQKLTIKFESTRPFGLHRHNYVSCIRQVNLISASISSIFLIRSSTLFNNNSRCSELIFTFADYREFQIHLSGSVQCP